MGMTTNLFLVASIGFHFKSSWRFPHVNMAYGELKLEMFFCRAAIKNRTQRQRYRSRLLERHELERAAQPAALISETILYEGWSACCEAPAFNFAILQAPCRGIGQG